MFRITLGLIGLSALLTLGFAGQDPLDAAAKKPSARYTELGYDGNFLAALQVKDIERSIEFYTKILGFELVMHAPEIGWAEVASPATGAVIGLGKPEEGEPKLLDGPSLSFGVTDIEASVALLKKSRVSFEGDIMTIPDTVSLATFADPDGNKLMLHQSLMKGR